jgi:hypothetical protein
MEVNCRRVGKPAVNTLNAFFELDPLIPNTLFSYSGAGAYRFFVGFVVLS